MGLYKTLFKRLIFDESDEIEIRLSLLYCLNILEYIWWLLNSELYFHIKDIARNFQNVIGKRLLGDIYWSPKNIGIVRCYLAS